MSRRDTASLGRNEMFFDLWSSDPPVADGHIERSEGAVALAEPLEVDSEAEGEDEDQGKLDRERHGALKRKLQTAPARQAKAVKKAVAKQSQEFPAPVPERDYASRLQKKFFTLMYQKGSYQKPSVNLDDDQNDVKQQFARERSRCVWSFLLGLKSSIQGLFSGREGLEHTLNVCIADDTTTKLKPSAAGRNVVFTIMNTVQSAVTRFADGHWDCLHVPSPIRCLKSGKSSAIHKAFTSWLLVSASGLGEIWQRLGCDERLLNASRLRTMVFMGDALRANEAAWKAERAARLKAGDVRSLGIRLKCSNHQLCLVRKPTVLSIPNFWTTIVRLGHLMETQSFRRSFAAGLVALLQQEGQFVRVPVYELPEDMQTWKERTSWLLQDFVTSAKTTLKAFEDMVSFGNGDSTKSTVVHWCLMASDGRSACCQSDSEALCKMLSHVVPAFSNGFPTPLLYRMNHYGQASSYIKLGCCYFNLVPRALKMMQTMDPNSDSMSLVDVFLQESGFQAGEADLQQLIADAMDMDRN